MIRCQQSPLTQEQASRLLTWFSREERHLFEEVVRSRIVQAQVAALAAAEDAGRWPKYEGVVAEQLNEAARYQDFLRLFQSFAKLEDLSLSQPTLKPMH